METLLSTREVANVLNLHTNAVRRYIKSGQLRAFKLGKNTGQRWRIKASDLDVFIETAYSRKQK
jgi:excisionase family DNA binding protein